MQVFLVETQPQGMENPRSQSSQHHLLLKRLRNRGIKHLFTLMQDRSDDIFIVESGSKGPDFNYLIMQDDAIWDDDLMHLLLDANPSSSTFVLRSDGTPFGIALVRGIAAATFLDLIVEKPTAKVFEDILAGMLSDCPVDILRWPPGSR